MSIYFTLIVESTENATWLLLESAYPIGGRPVHRLRDDWVHGQQNIKIYYTLLTFYDLTRQVKAITSVLHGCHFSFEFTREFSINKFEILDLPSTIHPWNLIKHLSIRLCVYIYIYRPASWSNGQSLRLLIMRSRVRFPVLPWEFFLAGKDSPWWPWSG